MYELPLKSEVALLPSPEIESGSARTITDRVIRLSARGRLDRWMERVISTGHYLLSLLSLLSKPIVYEHMRSARGAQRDKEPFIYHIIIE